MSRPTRKSAETSAKPEHAPSGEPKSSEIPNAATPQPSTPFFWIPFVAQNSEDAILQAVRVASAQLVSEAGEPISRYKVVALFDADGSIGTFEADRIFTALTRMDGSTQEDVLLVLLSRGGSVEPAYQISKLCRSHAPGTFSVAVPRQAKSAATLIAIGADQIHMGPLSHLGPIDPQLGGLPALGVVQALESIAALAEKFPGSADMLSRYLRMVLTVEQIGYCQRISESAMQYAERLLSTKPSLKSRAKEIARELVYEYKDHGFVIDADEARAHLGEEWILLDSPEARFAEKLYRLYEEVNLGLRLLKNSRLLLVGEVTSDFMILKATT